MSATLAPRAQSLVPPSGAPKQSLATISPKDAAAALAAMEAPVEAQFQPRAYGVDESGFVTAG